MTNPVVPQALVDQSADIRLVLTYEVGRSCSVPVLDRDEESFEIALIHVRPPPPRVFLGRAARSQLNSATAGHKDQMWNPPQNLEEGAQRRRSREWSGRSDRDAGSRRLPALQARLLSVSLERLG